MDILELKKTDLSSYQRHPWERVRAKIIYQLIKKNGRRFEHLVDIGSGDAYVLGALCSHGIADRYTAIDIAYDPDIVEMIQAASKCNINFENHLPGQMQPPPDLILLLDVIEHCSNDTVIISDLKNISLGPCKVMVTAPAYQSLFSTHDKLLHHYRRYTLKQLKELCRTEGLNVEEGGYFFFSLLLIRWVQLFLEKIGLRKPKNTINNWKAGKWVTSVVTYLLWTDYKIGRFFLGLGFRLPGLSAYCICRR